MFEERSFLRGAETRARRGIPSRSPICVGVFDSGVERVPHERQADAEKEPEDDSEHGRSHRPRLHLFGRARSPQQRGVPGLQRLHRAELLAVLHELRDERRVGQAAGPKFGDPRRDLPAGSDERGVVELLAVCDVLLRVKCRQEFGRGRVTMGGRKVENVCVRGGGHRRQSEERFRAELGDVRACDNALRDGRRHRDSRLGLSGSCRILAEAGEVLEAGQAACKVLVLQENL